MSIKKLLLYHFQPLLSSSFSAYKTDIKTSFNSLSIIAVAPHTTCPSISKAGTLMFLAYVNSVASIIFYRSKTDNEFNNTGNFSRIRYKANLLFTDSKKG
jgi:hypothetical protein